MNRQQYAPLISRLWDSFRLSGLVNPLIVAEQISYLLFLRYIDTMKYQPVQFEEDTLLFRWRNLTENLEMVGIDKFFHFFQKQLVPFYNDVFVDERDTIFHQMKEVPFVIPKAELLWEAINTIDSIYSSIQKNVTNDENFFKQQGEMYEYLLEQIDRSSGMGRFSSPRQLVRLIVEMCKPTEGEEVYDPVCGTGGFLVEVAKRTQEASKLFGSDLDPTMVRLTIMNLLMHGYQNSYIKNQDVLRERMPRQFDYVLGVPPFQMEIGQDFRESPYSGITETSGMFVDIMIQQTKPNGKIAVVVPQSFLSLRGKELVKWRAQLVQNYRVEGIVSLGAEVFAPYFKYKTALLLLEKTDNSNGVPQTDKIWYYTVRQLDEKTSKDLLLKWNQREKDWNRWGDRSLNRFLDSPEVWFADYAMISQNKFNLSAKTYDPFKEYSSNCQSADSAPSVSTDFRTGYELIERVQSIHKSSNRAARLPKQSEWFLDRLESWQRELFHQFRGTPLAIQEVTKKLNKVRAKENQSLVEEQEVKQTVELLEKFGLLERLFVQMYTLELQESNRAFIEFENEPLLMELWQRPREGGSR